MSKQLVELVEWVCGCSCTHDSGQCVRWDVISSRAVDKVKTIAREFKSPTQEFFIRYLSSVMLVRHIWQWFLIRFQNEVPSSQEVSPVHTVSIMACGSFSMDACFNSLPWRVREKNATGLPFWLSFAASATSDAPVSTSNKILSSTAVTTVSSIVFLRLSNVPVACCVVGKICIQQLNSFDLRILGSIGSNKRTIPDTYSGLWVVWNRKLT